MVTVYKNHEKVTNITKWVTQSQPKTSENLPFCMQGSSPSNWYREGENRGKKTVALSLSNITISLYWWCAAVDLGQEQTEAIF